MIFNSQTEFLWFHEKFIKIDKKLPFLIAGKEQKPTQVVAVGRNYV